MIIELLCIKSHYTGKIKAGNTYPLLGENKCIYCGDKLVNVGIESSNSFKGCSNCRSIEQSDGIHWFRKTMFIEIATEDEIKQEEDIKENQRIFTNLYR